MDLDTLIDELIRIRQVMNLGKDRVVVITKSGAVKPLNGRIVFDAVANAVAIKTVS